MQYLLLRSYNSTKITNIASMTAEQARLGSFSDGLNIIKTEPLLESVYEFTSNPREIRNKINGSRLFFNSYRDSNRAKGIASDFLFINEANTFSRAQYIDLSVNAREAIFLDYNPNGHFWIDDYFEDDEILKKYSFLKFSNYFFENFTSDTTLAIEAGFEYISEPSEDDDFAIAELISDGRGVAFAATEKVLKFKTVNGAGTVQGGCTDGKYVYVGMMGKSDGVEFGVVSKYDITTGEIIGSSDRLPTFHTNDLHASERAATNITTEYEENFLREGKPICCIEVTV